jgi:hypothetical protein
MGQTDITPVFFYGLRWKYDKNNKAIPLYQVRRGVEPASGFNDWPGILVKYRLLDANEQSGNYVVTVFAQYGLPTGALVFTNGYQTPISKQYATSPATNRK